MRGFTALLLGISLLSLVACGGSSKKTFRHGAVDEGLSNIQPYVSNSAYAAVLKRCATADDGRSCTLNELPALGMDAAIPSVANIMARTLVSHAWMGQRFEEVLNEMPEDMRYLFGSLTAIVIDDDIRPSYYDPSTAAIYLDPDGLWLTEAERSVINQKPDYRGEFIARMAYRPVWRYVNGPPDDVRSINTIVVDMAQLLFHELAHANDIFPQSTFATVNRSLRVEQVTNSLYDSFPSTLLLVTYPLESTTMFTLGGILYRGDTPSESFRTMTAAQVGGHFAPDGANDDYNYSSQYEDVAMLFEEAMMKFHFDMDRDVGFTSAANSFNCDDYILGWGMRNRLGVEKVKTRAQWVVSRLLPNSDYSFLFEIFPQAQPLRTNVSWCDSEPSLPNSREKSFAKEPANRMINPRHLLPRSALQAGG